MVLLNMYLSNHFGSNILLLGIRIFALGCLVSHGSSIFKTVVHHRAKYASMLMLKARQAKAK